MTPTEQVDRDSGAAAEPPSRPTRVNAESVHAAADAIVMRGRRPTIEAIRSELGGASPNTVSTHLDTWYASVGARLRAGTMRAPQDPPDPGDDVPPALLERFRDVWTTAQAMATADLAHERSEVNAERDAIAAERAQLLAAAQQHAVERQAREAHIAHLTQQVEHLQRDHAKAVSDREATLLALSGAHAETQAARNEAAANAAAASREAARLDALTETLQAAGDRERALITQLQESEAHARKAEERATLSDTQFTALQRANALEIAALRHKLEASLKDLDRERSALAVARQSAASLTEDLRHQAELSRATDAMLQEARAELIRLKAEASALHQRCNELAATQLSGAALQALQEILLHNRR